MNCPKCGNSIWLVREHCPFCKTNIPAFLESKVLEAAQVPAVTEQITSFVKTALASPATDDDQLANRLMSAGLSREVSERLLAFVPIAFGRYVFEAKGARFPPGFGIVDSDSGLSRRGSFRQEVIYVAAQEYAKRLGAAHPTVTAIAQMSAEVQLLAGLSEVGSMQFTEPIFLRIPLEKPPKPARPWWKPFELTWVIV
jgi:hypothetical protein